MPPAYVKAGGQPTTPKSEALAIVASPSHLCSKGSKEAAVSMGLVFISPYIEVVSFASVHIALKDWMEEGGAPRGDPYPLHSARPFEPAPTPLCGLPCVPRSDT